MAIQLTCSECGGLMRCGDEMAGRRVRCPACKAVMAVPGSGARSSAEAAPVVDTSVRAMRGGRAAKTTPPADNRWIWFAAAGAAVLIAVGVGIYLGASSSDNPNRSNQVADASTSPERKEAKKEEKKQEPAKSEANPKPETPSNPKPHVQPEPEPEENEFAVPPETQPGEPNVEDPPEGEVHVEVFEIKPTPSDPTEPEPSPPVEDTPEKPETAPKKPVERPIEKPPVVAGPVDGNCPQCRGLGRVPLDPFTPYLHVEGMPRPKSADAVPCRFCPKCQAARDNDELVQKEKARIDAIGPKHQAWEQVLTSPLVRVENHHVTIHAQLPPPQASEVGVAVEKLTAHLQEVTGSMALTLTRPDTYEILIVWGPQNYRMLLQRMEGQWRKQMGNDWGMLSELAGSTIGPTSFFRQEENGPPPAHSAVFMTAGRQILLATGGRAPVWLREGFSSYCENTIMGANRVHSIQYDVKKFPFGPDWIAGTRQLAAAGQLTPWEKLFRLQLRDYELPDYLTAFATVGYLLQIDPDKFLEFVRLTREGKEPGIAMEAAYKKKFEKLQAEWAAWVMGQG